MTRANNGQRPGPYRSRRGFLLGVCHGLADYAGISVLWVRLAVIALFLITGFWPTLLAYVIAALVMKKAPVITFTCESDREFYESYAMNKRRALHRLQRLHKSLTRRLERIEGVVTGKDYDWEQRLKSRD